MINEHELFVITMSFLAAYFAVLLMIATASFMSYHRALHRRVRMHLINTPDRVQAGWDEDEDEDEGGDEDTR